LIVIVLLIFRRKCGKLSNPEYVADPAKDLSTIGVEHRPWLIKTERARYGDKFDFFESKLARLHETTSNIKSNRQLLKDYDCK
jgi:hypothetical protein